MDIINLIRKEKISKSKEMIMHKISNDTFIIGLIISCCIKGNFKIDSKIDNTIKTLDNIPSDFELFVQSTSHNRLIPSGVKTLVRVSIRDALNELIK